jgi:hypothetical protein
MITRYSTRKIAGWAFLILAITVVVGYGIFATHDFVIGPTMTILEPVSGSTFTTPSIRIKGVVSRIQDIRLNGRSITIDDRGNFDEAILLAPGYNIFTLEARDKFGRSKDVRLELIYKVN